MPRAGFPAPEPRLNAGASMLELALMKERGVFGRALGLAPFVEHVPLDLVHLLDHGLFVRIGAGEFDAVPVRIEEVDRMKVQCPLMGKVSTGRLVPVEPDVFSSSRETSSSRAKVDLVS